MGGFTIRLGLSELGPLDRAAQRQLPGRDHARAAASASTINDFFAGVEFFKSLPSIDDPFAAARAAIPAADRDVRRRVARRRSSSRSPTQCLMIKAEPGHERVRGRVHLADDDHRLGEDLLDLHVASRSSTARCIVKISTDGKFLIVGKLNFAADNLSISGRLYADLSRVSRATRRCSSSPTSRTRSACSRSTAS